MKARRVRTIASRCVNAAFWFASGGYAIAGYVEATNPSLPRLADLRQNIWFAWLLLLILSGILQRNRSRWAMYEPSPAANGTTVVLVMGLAGALLVIANSRSSAAIALAIAMAGATLIVAWLVHRFASRNAHRIGEARFETSGSATGLRGSRTGVL